LAQFVVFGLSGEAEEVVFALFDGLAWSCGSLSCGSIKFILEREDGGGDELELAKLKGPGVAI
jgi:hypothetical protein